jgi:hypothetical protein
MKPPGYNDEPVILQLPAIRAGDQAPSTPTVRRRRARRVGVTHTIGWTTAVLFIAICAPALCGFVYTADDLGAFHLPLRAFYAEALDRGDAFDWCPSLFGGFYLTGEGQAGTYHPLHVLLYRWLPLAWAWNIECLTSYPFIFGGVWLLLARRGFARAESMWGALVFTLCGFNLLHFVHVNAISVVAHIPWLLYAIDRLATRKLDWQSDLRGVCLIAVLTASQLLIGYPQYIAYSLLAETLYLAFLLHEQNSAPDKASWLRLSGVWVTAKLWGLALGAVQIAPTVEALGDSVRQGVDASFSEAGSLHPLNIVQLVAPYLFTTRVAGQNTHELSLYVGIVPLLLSIVALANRRWEESHSLLLVKRFAAVLIALGALVALGRHGPLHALVAQLPLAGYFRFPCRAIVLFQFGIGLLAAVGFAVIYRGIRLGHPIELPRRALWLLAFAGLAFAMLGPSLWSDYTTADWRRWYGPAVLVLAIAVLTCAAKGSRLALHAIVVLAAIDLAAYGLSYAVYRDAYRLQDYIAVTPAPPIGPGERVALDLARPDDDGLRVGNQVLLQGYSRIDGYAGLVPARALDYRQSAALRVAGVAAVATNASTVPDKTLHEAIDGWLHVGEPLPRVRLVRSYRATDEPATEIAHIDPGTEVLIQASDLALVSTRLDGKSSELAPSDSARVVRDRGGDIAIDVIASRPAILVLNESYHRGWNVATRGIGPALRVNGDFLGCLVPEGRSTVEFRFAPTSLWYGRLISVCGLGLLVIFVAAATWRRASSARRPAHRP